MLGVFYAFLPEEGNRGNHTLMEIELFSRRFCKSISATGCIRASTNLFVFYQAFFPASFLETPPPVGNHKRAGKEHRKFAPLLEVHVQHEIRVTSTSCSGSRDA